MGATDTLLVVRLALVLALVAALAAGCGADTEGGDDGGAVRKVVERFGEASAAKDYQTICDELLAETLVQKVQAIGLPCETALQKGLADVRSPHLEVRDVAVSGGRALVSVHSTAEGQPASDDAIQLVREDGEWRIASLAEPSGGASTTTPSATTTATATKTATTKTATTKTATTKTATTKTATTKTATTKTSRTTTTGR